MESGSSQLLSSHRSPEEMSKPVISAENDLTLGDMSAEEFRRFGHEIVDWIANYFERIEQFPVLAHVYSLRSRRTVLQSDSY